jgi:hypothetical protein
LPPPPFFLLDVAVLVGQTTTWSPGAKAATNSTSLPFALHPTFTASPLPIEKSSLEVDTAVAAAAADDDDDDAVEEVLAEEV